LNGTERSSAGNSPHAPTTDPAVYRIGSEFVTEYAQHIPNLWVSVEPYGIVVQSHPNCTLAEQFSALQALAQRLGVQVTPSDVVTAPAGHRYYANEFRTTYCGVEVRGFQHVRVDELATV
jgi:hypothetical protein